MSTYYLINPYSTDGDITDVLNGSTGTAACTGSFVVRVPDGVSVHGKPTNYADLIDAKYTGLLAANAGFSYILGDSCNDTLSFAGEVASGASLVNGGFGNHCLLTMGASAGTNGLALMSAPTQVLLFWEAYTFQVEDPKTGRLSMTYVEEDSSLITAEVSFDGSTPSISAPGSGSVINIPVLEQGSNFKVTFTNASSSRVYLGSFALIY